jgi:hypothetical protein
MDWKDHCVTAYDLELQTFIDDAGADRLSGSPAWSSYAVATDACGNPARSYSLSLPRQHRLRPVCRSDAQLRSPLGGIDRLAVLSWRVGQCCWSRRIADMTDR